MADLIVKFDMIVMPAPLHCPVLRTYGLPIHPGQALNDISILKAKSGFDRFFSLERPNESA